MLLNARHSAPSTPHAHILQVLVSTHPLLCCGCCGKKWICHAHPKHSLPASLPQPPHATQSWAAAVAALEMLLRFAGIFWQECFYIKPDSSQPDDETKPSETKPDQTRQLSECSACWSRRCWHPLLPACCHSQRFRFWQFVSNLALIFHTGHRKLKCSHNGKSLACQKWRLRERQFIPALKG